MLVLTPVYASILALIFLVLSFRVVTVRRSNKIAVGDGGNTTLARRARVHGNFAEYVPIVLLLMAFAEFNGSVGWQVNLAGMSLLAGRIFHSIGMSREPDILPFRVLGMLLTFSALLISVLLNLSQAFT